MKKKNIILFLIVLIIVCTIDTSFAEVPVTGALDTVKNSFRDNSNHWVATLQTYAERIFWILAAIDFAWMAIMVALSMGEFTDFVAQVVRKILFLGFFLALLKNGHAWAGAILDSVRQAAGQANAAAGGAANITPSDVFDTGYQLCATIIKTLAPFSHPADSLGLLIGAFIIMACFALIAAMMLLVYVQAYVILNAGVILLGFGGTSFTKDIALKYFQSAFATGIKLFVMILVVGLGQNILTQWITDFNASLEQICLFIGASIVLLALVKAIPDMVGDLINGFSWGAGEPLAQRASSAGGAAVSAGAGAVAGAVGGFMAVSQASKLHKAQVSSGSSSSSWVGGVAKNLASAAKDDVAGRLTGNNRGFGTMGGRMASDMKKSSLESSSGMQDEPYFAAGPAKSQTKPQGNTNEQQNA